jgi:adenylate cyclase
LAVLASGAVYLTVAEYTFAANGTWLPVAIPLFIQVPLGYSGLLLRNYVEINRERKNIRKALSFYVPDDVVEELARNVVDLKKGDQAVDGICLLTDIAGYTTVSESLGPRELSDLMRLYLAAALEPIKRNGGVVIDLTGDSILAIWKAAKSDLQTRRQVCNAAVELASTLQRLNHTNGSLGLPTRIGVHAGPIFLGNIGTGDNYRYGVRGDTVNTVARMDSLNKQLGTEVLVSEEVLQGLNGFLAREAGRFLLKGKSHPIVMYELLGKLEEVTESQKTTCRLFSEGLEAFRSRSWDKAEEIFDKVIEISNHSGLPQFYKKRSGEYKINSPSGAWDGTITLEEK